MNSEFHYYITGIIANYVGFSREDCITIAYSSQFVDDNKIVFTVKDKETDEEYSNYVSQTMNILRPMKTLMRIYPLFHFIPGDPMAESARRKDGKMHILNTTPNSDLAQEVLHKAFMAPAEKRMYRIGIASHSYVDTWAHQNFVGFNDSFNGVGLNPIPNVGHSDVVFNPDKIKNEWTDKRLVKSEIRNNDRFILAAKHLFYKYTEYLGVKVEWNPIKEVLLAITNTDNEEKRLGFYSSLVPWLLPYNKKYWFEKATDCEIHGLEDFESEFASKLTIWEDDYFWKDGIKKEDTDWFKFQESVKDHQKEILPKINDIYKLMDIDIKLF